MSQQVINVGSGELAGDGESLRSALTKVNANFTELYTSGVGGNGPQGPQGPSGSSGASGPQGPTGPNNFTSIGSHVLPSSNLTYDLGSTSSQWRSLYVGTSTIYIGGKALSITPAGEITVDGSPVSGGASNLGNFKISGNNLGTVDNPDTGGWGGWDMYIDPGNGSDAFIYIPGVPNQAASTNLQISNNSTAGAIQLFGRGGVQVVVNHGVNEKVFEFADSGQLFIPDAILGSGDQPLVIQNTASGVAYLELPVDPSTNSVILANQAANSATVTIRVGDFGNERDWTFNEFGALAVPGVIYNTDPSNVGQLLLSGDYGEAATYLALPSDVGSTSMNVRLANHNGSVQIIADNNKYWYFNGTGGLELPGGSVLATSGYDVALVAGNDGSSTFGSVTINTQAPPAVYTVIQQSSPFGFDAVYTSDILTPNYASIVPGMVVTGSGITALTTVTSVTGPDVYGTITINVSTPGTQLPYLETYTFTTPGGITDRNWEFNSLGELNLPQGGAIQETQVTNELWGTTTTSLTLVPGGAANGTQRLEIYSTGGGEGDHIHITSGDQTQTDLFLGNDTQYFSVHAMGQMEVRARPGLASPSPGNPAYAGSPVWIYAGDAGDNGGNQADGALGGDIILQAGTSTIGPVGLGGSVYLQSGNGISGYGSIKLSTDNGSTHLEFNKDGRLTLPSGITLGPEGMGASGLSNGTSGNPVYIVNKKTNGDYLANIILTAGDGISGEITFEIWNTQTASTKTLSINTACNLVFDDGSIQTTAWTKAAASVQSTPPSSPVTGQLYYDTDDGRTYIYTGAAWIDSSPAAGAGVTSITAGTGTAISTSTGAITIWNTGGVGTVLEETFETKNTVTGVTVHDCTTNRLFYLTNVSGNFTPNLTNLNLASGEATSISIVVVQTSTARSISGVQIAGTTTGVVLSWQGSISAPSGNASRTEVFTFSVLCTGSNAYTVLGMMTSFGGV